MGASSLDEALYAATIGCQHSIMEALTQRGANLNARMSNGFTPLHAAACTTPFTPQIQILLDNKADLNASTEGRFGGYNALHLACSWISEWISKA
jgi:ankyrin repeat protein